MSAHQTISSSRASLADSVEHLTHGAEQALQNVRDRVGPSATRWATQAEDLAHRGVGAMRDQSEHLRERARDVSDRGLRFVKDEPVKAVLIAAAVGALLAVLLRSSRSLSDAAHKRHPG